MSTSIGEGQCPKCGRTGMLVIKYIGGNYYAYFRHGREWHYVGPLRDVHESLRSSLTGEALNEFTKFLSRIGLVAGASGVISESSGILVHGLSRVRMGILYTLILGIVVYVVNASLIAVELISGSTALIGGITIVLRVTAIVNSLVSALITYYFIYEGFNQLNRANRELFHVGFDGAFIRFVFLIIAFLASILILPLPTTESNAMVIEHLITALIGIPLVVAWALIFTPLYKLASRFNIGLLSVGIIFAMLGYILDLVPSMALFSAIVQFVGEVMVFLGLGNLVSAIPRLSDNLLSPQPP